MSELAPIPVTEESLKYDFWFDEEGTPYLIENSQHTHDIDLDWDPIKSLYCSAPSPEAPHAYWIQVPCKSFEVENYVESPFAFVRRLAERVINQ